MDVVASIAEMQRRADGWRASGRRIGLVPTMGFLHEGHLSLVREARRRADLVVVSIFVNPTQFNSRADFDRYPRDVERDRRLLEAEGVDVVFVPEADEMYPEGYQTQIEVGELSRPLCGAHRPGHFGGVATIVTKLLLAAKPHVAVFGAKDYQQLLVVRRLVCDLNLDVAIVAGPIVREADGLAMSSRNARLGEADRERARAVPAGIADIVRRVRAGERDARGLVETFAAAVREAGLEPEYAEFRDPVTLDEVSSIAGPVLFAVAAWCGGVRLIDNAIIDPETARAEARAPVREGVEA